MSLPVSDNEYNRLMLDEMAAHAIHERAEAALWLIQAGWDDKIVADVVGLPGLNAGVSA